MPIQPLPRYADPLRITRPTRPLSTRFLRRRARARSKHFFAVGSLLVILLASGCSNRDRIMGTDNQPPEVAFDPAFPPTRGPEGATHLVGWTGRDADGRIDHYRVAVNPRTLDDDDPAWVATTERRRSVLARRRIGPGALRASGAEDGLATQDGREFDLIAVEAVDDRGARSTPAVRAFFADNIAPSVQITQPQPSALLTISMPPTFTVHWVGQDPDAPNGQPASYKYILLGPGSAVSVDVARAFPDSVRRYYAPNFDGWTTVPGTTTQATFSGLDIGPTYVFVIVAIDAQGAYTPYFTFYTNMFSLRVAPAAALGPRLTFYTSFFNFEGPGGAFPGPEIQMTIPAGQPVTMNWYATPGTGHQVTGYRWVLDPDDLDQEFKRPKAGNDTHHWRPWSLTTTNVTLGPFQADGIEHILVIEAKDEQESKSRLTIRIPAVAAPHNEELLIVDDTRLQWDEIGTGGCVKAPKGQWPTAAELDTFLFARGATPWRCYPPGAATPATTPPGLFAGYRFDTLGTRTGQADPSVPLATLNRYRHVIWIVDAKSALYSAPGTDRLAPITALRAMSGMGRLNPLAAYVAGGGQVWLLGGGAATALMMPWNQVADDGGGLTWTNHIDELVPGRFMYDAVHWRSEIKAATVSGFVQRELGRGPVWPGAPAYLTLPVTVRAKSGALDPLPPGRAGQPSTLYYRSTFDFEFLSRPNQISEDLSTNAHQVNEQSTVDSLYKVTTFTIPPTTEKRILMTYYHGHDNASVMFTGFDIWSYTRADCQSIVDFVLGDVWGLQKDAATEALVRVTPMTHK